MSNDKSQNVKCHRIINVISINNLFKKVVLAQIMIGKYVNIINEISSAHITPNVVKIKYSIFSQSCPF